MERLTFDGLFCDIAKCDETPGGTFCETGSCTQRKVWERLKEYEDAEQDGRLVVLPCKVGDHVWYITSSTEICEAAVIGIWLNVYTNPQMWLEIKYHSKFTGEGEHKSRIDLMLGKTVFLTREEAESALAGNTTTKDFPQEAPEWKQRVLRTFLGGR